MQRILVTGVTGFIGGNLVAELLNDSVHEVVGMARNPIKASRWESQGIEMRYAKLNQPSSLQGITRDVDVVIHLAGLMRFHASWHALYLHNVMATKALVYDAIKQNVDRFIYASSTESMGPVDVIPSDESAPCHPVYEYGKTKLLAEQWLREQHEKNGFPIVILRPTGVYGPDDAYVTFSTLRGVKEGKLRRLPGDGNRYIHFTYIEDVVRGFIRAITAGPSAIGETFIVASDDYHTYQSTFAIISELLGVSPPRYGISPTLLKGLAYLVERYNRLRGVDDFIMHTSVIDDMLHDRAYSNVKAKKTLDFQPRYGYIEGMQRTIEGFRRKGWL
jgi:nucleoside-diphosphate-sugar epimerase